MEIAMDNTNNIHPILELYSNFFIAQYVISN